jgi:hypothetical protein
MSTYTPPAPTQTDTLAARFYELASTGQNETIMREMYADDCKHVEAMEMPGCPRITSGKPALIEKAIKFKQSITVHGGTCSKPMVNGDQFICEMTMDCTANDGPMAGQRMNMREYCLYTTKNGKITEARFFYNGCGA